MELQYTTNTSISKINSQIRVILLSREKNKNKKTNKKTHPQNTNPEHLCLFQFLFITCVGIILEFSTLRILWSQEFKPPF